MVIVWVVLNEDFRKSCDEVPQCESWFWPPGAEWRSMKGCECSLDDKEYIGHTNKNTDPISMRSSDSTGDSTPGRLEYVR